jgi:CheY-like chemotaxis protein
VRTPPRILVVDDNPTNVKILQTRLANAGYDLVTAGDGEEALVTARESAPDLILLDVMMPKLDGFELCRLLRSIEITRNIPIIMVTTLGDQKSQETAAAAGCNDFITKPIERSELVTKIARILQPTKRGD